MKKIFKLLVILCAAVLSFSCSSEKAPEIGSKIIGEWHLISVSGLSSAPQVYVGFSQDFSFELYQKVGEGRFRKYVGTYNVSGTTLSGKYSDGEDWGCEYAVSFADNNLVMKALNGSEEVCKYEKKALPESDKANAYLVTKSEEDGLRFL